jgi:magnesium transporter
MIETVLEGDASVMPMWVDLCNPTPEELSLVAAQRAIPRAALDESTAPLHLPKHERYGGTTFVITRVFDDESAPEAHAFFELTRKLAIFLSDRMLITVHRRALPCLESFKNMVRNADSPIYLQVVMLDMLLMGVETFHEPLEQLELRIHAFEAKFLEEGGTGAQPIDDWQEVFRTKVRIQAFKRLLWHTHNATQKFVPRSAVNQPLAADLRERIASLTFLADSLDSDLDNLLGVQLSLAANRTNDVMRLLTLFSAVFLPLTFITSVYGMNFRNMPELDSPYGYAGVWALMGVSAVLVVAWIRKLRLMR